VVTGDQTERSPRTIVVTGARGGQGTTTVAAALALQAARHGRVVLVAAPDQQAAALLGVPASDHGEIVEITGGLTLAAQAHVIGADTVVVDGGLHAADAGLAASESYVVLRGPCYLALATLLASDSPRPGGIILVAEEGRSLTAKDVCQVTGVPVVATVTASERVARTIDAGLLVSRLPRLHELDDLRGLAAPRTIAAPRQRTGSDAMTNRSETHTDLPLWRPAITAVGASAEISMSRFARARHLSPMWDRFARHGHAEHRPTEPRRGRLLHRRGRHLGRGLLHRPGRVGGPLGRLPDRDTQPARLGRT
jgi:hypothetical protein